MEEILKIPEGVNVRYENGIVYVAGKLGEVSKKLSYPTVKIEINNGEVKISSDENNRKAKRMIKTFAAHIKNLFKGVQEGFTYKLKVIYTHFPVTVKVEGDKIIIENFIGERAPRYAKKLPGAEVKVQKQDITVTGIDLDAVSQTAANIERAARIVGKDRRIFQDGIYIVEKGK
jgi:large subunit ribosomal protein L6